MAPEKSPAFQFYPKEFLTDGNVAAMSLQERGAYITLLCICWQEKSLPSDLRRLANIVGLPQKAFQKLWPALAGCFVTYGDRLLHPRLEKEREKQAEFSETQRTRGQNRATGAVREGGKFTSQSTSRTPAEPPARHQPEHQPRDQPTTSSPISDLRSPISGTDKIPPSANLSVDSDIQKKAGLFLDKYPQIYAEERRGAHFQLKPVLHFMTACELVQGWPDDRRLELMFRTFCRLPSSEKMAWPGTPAQFLHLAPELDAKLREAGV